MSLEKINLNFVGIDFCGQLKELYKNYRNINANRMYVIKNLPDPWLGQAYILQAGF